MTVFCQVGIYLASYTSSRTLTLPNKISGCRSTTDMLDAYYYVHIERHINYLDNLGVKNAWKVNEALGLLLDEDEIEGQGAISIIGE